MGEIQLRVDALGVHIHGHGDHIQVAGALTVAEQGGLNAVGASQQTHLSSGDTGATVVVGVEGDDGTLPTGQVADEVFQLIGELIRHTVFDRGRQVQDDLVVFVCVEGGHDGVTDLVGGVHLGAHEGLRRVFVADVCAGGDHGLAHLVDHCGGIGGDLLDTFYIGVKDHLPLEGGGGVVEVEDDVLAALNGLKCPADEVGTGLHQYLDGHVIGDVAILDEGAQEVKFGLRSRGEANLDLLHPDVHQGVEQQQLFFHIHGIHQRLVAVPQIDRAPDRGFGDGVVRPGAVLDGLGDKGDIFLETFHDKLPPNRFA